MDAKESLALIHAEELQILQEEFCLVTNVALGCLDAEMRKVTNFSGDEALKKRIAELEASGGFEEVLERVAEGSLEEQAIERIGLEGQVAATSIRVDGETYLYWILYSQDASGNNSNHLYHVLDLLRDTSVALFRNKVSRFDAEKENMRSQFAEREMEKNISSVEATAEIVQLLDSEDQIEKIMMQWMEILGKHLGADSGFLYKVHPGNETMDIVGEWSREGVAPYFDRTSGIEAKKWLSTDKPLVYSTDTAAGELWNEIRGFGVKATMVFPVIRHAEGGGIGVSISYFSKEHNWEMSEVKFTSDAVRVLQNILDRRIQKNSLISSYRTLEAILDNVSCSIYVVDKESGKKLFANRKLQNTFASELRDGHFENILKNSMEQGNDNGGYEVHHMMRDRWYDLIFKDVLWVDGKNAILYSLYDITDKKLYQRKIEQQAYTDFLTGLYNRMCCERDLARWIDETQKNGTKGAVLYMDLDDFKHINDGLGHQYGDALLKTISQSIQRVKGITNSCYRMGGDEFVIVVPPASFPDLERIISDIKEIFAKPWYLKDTDYYCTMSMGIITFPDLGDTVADLTKKADIAMYEAKKGGKNRIMYYNESSNSASGRRLDMEKNMRDATTDGYKEFEIYYQPIVDVENDGACTGAEALIRWNSEKLGFIPPADFIPLAEYLGLITPIGNYVLVEACKHCKAWNDNGFPNYKVNVNLSVVQLLQPDVVEVVDKAIHDTGINPANLTLEVTESLAINDMERMKEILGRIKALGVKIALDDFGTGYSSLNHIREIPFDVIKVDQSFVRDLAADAYSQSFVKMVTELANTLGVKICVEGIETMEQYRIVRDMKVKYIQGYYFDCPMTKRAFEEKYCSEKRLAKDDATR